MYGPGKDCRDLPSSNGNILSCLLHKGKLQNSHQDSNPIKETPCPSTALQSPVPGHHFAALQHGKNGLHSSQASPDSMLRPDYRSMPPQLIQMSNQFRPPGTVSHTISSPNGHSDDLKPVKHVIDHERERKFVPHLTPAETETRYMEQVRFPDHPQEKLLNYHVHSQQSQQVYEAGSYQRTSPAPVEREHRDSVESMEAQSFPMTLSSREALTPDKTDTDSGVYTDSEQDEPMDLSCRRNSTPVSDTGTSSPPTPEPGTAQSHGCFNIAIADTQYLRELLSRTGEELSSSPKEHTTARALYTKVTLAKKNLLPVSARVSDWLMKIVQFSESIPEFKNLTQNDKVTLLLSSWSRVLLLYMAENNFHFVVSPDTKEGVADSQTPFLPQVPTVKSVEMILSLIRKYQLLNLDAKEYLMLRIAVLFQCDAGFLEKPEIVESVRQQVQEFLQQHVQVTRPDDVMRYAKLLMSLPVLYSIDDKMMENLFCKHITGDTDVTVLLKEMLKSI